MFASALHGMVHGKIAGVLNGEKILSLCWYRAVKYGSGSCKHVNPPFAICSNRLAQLQDHHSTLKDNTLSTLSISHLNHKAKR